MLVNTPLLYGITWRVAIALLAAVALAAMSGDGAGPPAHAQQSDPDRSVLRSFYEATGGENWTNNTNWLSDRPIGQWHGATTDEDGRVTHLVLSENGLTGYVRGQLAGLDRLTWLDLHDNQLWGPLPVPVPDPEAGGSLSNLARLDLGRNWFSGSLPAGLGSLSNLTVLHLDNNQLSGEIPAGLGDLSNLTTLSLDNNQLSGEIPAELGDLSNLTLLNLSDNQLSGAIPAQLGDLSNLTQLFLHENQLSGTIPSELGNLSNLTVLYLDNNQLSGEIPAELGALSNLTVLYLDNNQLSGAIPSELSNLSNLTVLYLHDNQLSTSIPAELGNLSNLTVLHLDNNQLSGAIPSELGNLSNLTELYLRDNQLSGEIPAELGDLSNLTLLNLSDNQLSGAIPAQLGALSNLTQLFLHENQLSGTIPSELGNLSNLTVLYLDNNQLSAAIPAELGALSNLTQLFLYENQLSGAIPSELSNLSNLMVLYLHDNQLSTSIPAELGDLSSLTELNLRDNQLSGEIPAELGHLSSLTQLDLYNNQLTGDIPARLADLTNLTQLYLSNNQLSGTIPAELGDLSNLTTLSLQNNRLSGSIPTGLGGLSNLSFLGLNSNQLTGAIPAELADLTNLTRLFLNNNRFSCVPFGFLSFHAGIADNDQNALYQSLSECPVRGLRAAVGDGWVQLYYREPSRTRDGRVAGYQYRYSEGSAVPQSAEWSPVASTSWSGQVFAVRKLRNDVLHTFEVRGVTGESFGSLPAVVRATPSASAQATRPGGPLSFRATVDAPYLVDVHRPPTGHVERRPFVDVILGWDEPQDHGNAQIWYGVRHAEGSRVPGTAEWSYHYVSDLGDLTATVPHLKPGTRYAFQMVVENHVGLGPVSNTVTLTTPPYDGPSITLGLQGAAEEGRPYDITVSRTGPADSDAYVVLEIDDSAAGYIQHAWTVLERGRTSATADYTPPDDGQSNTGRRFTVRIADADGEYAYESIPYATEVREAPTGSSRQAEAASIAGAPTFNSPGEDGVWVSGETVEVTFKFSHPVLVDTTGGTPQLEIRLGGTITRQAAYLRGSDSQQLVFGYTLVDGDGEHSSLLVDPDVLSLNGGSIRSVGASVDAVLDHQGAGAVYLPEEEGLDLQSAAVDGSVLTLTYNEVLDSSVTLPTSAFTVNVNGSYRSVDSVSVSGSAVMLTLSSAVASGDTVTVSYDKPSGPAFIRDTRGRTADSFSGEPVTNNTDAGGAQGQGGESETPNSPATGAPSIIGTAQVGKTLTASTSGISDSDGLGNATFAYQWLADDVEISDATSSTYTLATDDGGKTVKVRVSFTDDAGNSETVTSAATSPVAANVPGSPDGLAVSVNGTGKLDLSWDAPESDGGAAITGYRVQWKESSGSWDTPADVSEATATGTSNTVSGLTDGTEYIFRVAAVNSAGSSVPSAGITGTPRETTPPAVSSAAVDGATLTITFDEALDTGGTPDRSAFAVTVADDSRGVDTVAVSGSVVTLTLVTAVFAGDAVTVAYTAPAGESDARLKDPAGNAAESFSGRSVSNDTALAARLTATASTVPDSHDGHFTFELRFSETPHSEFSYKTMRDHAFNVTGGAVTYVRRLAPPSNVGWEVHLTPDGDGAVTVVLPVTTDCTAQGAICTEERRPLSERLEITVNGPDG